MTLSIMLKKCYFNFRKVQANTDRSSIDRGFCTYCTNASYCLPVKCGTVPGTELSGLIDTLYKPVNAGFKIWRNLRGNNSMSSSG